MLHVDNDLRSPLIAIPRRDLGYYSFPAYVMLRLSRRRVCHLDSMSLPCGHFPLRCICQVSLDTMLSRTGEYNTKIENVSKDNNNKELSEGGKTRFIGC